MKKKFEFSKLILSLVMGTYFIGLGFGMWIISRLASAGTSYTSTALCGMFTFIAAPTSAAIGFYSYKAKAENIEKIKSSIDPPESGKGEED